MNVLACFSGLVCEMTRNTAESARVYLRCPVPFRHVAVKRLLLKDAPV